MPTEARTRAFVEEHALTSVALVLADALQESGLSQREVANRLGVTEARVSQMLNPDSTNATVRTLARFADAVGCTLEFSMVKKSRRR